MDDLIKYVRAFQMAGGLPDRLRFAEEIFRVVEPDMRMYVFSRISHHTAEDTLQEVLKAIVTGLKKFEGSTDKEFWGWCYRIARNKLSDQCKQNEKMVLHPPEQLTAIIDMEMADRPLTAQTRLDLDYAMNLLKASKPECYDLLWKYFVVDFNYREIAEELDVKYNSVRMKITRCLETARSLIK